MNKIITTASIDKYKEYTFEEFQDALNELKLKYGKYYTNMNIRFALDNSNCYYEGDIPGIIIELHGEPISE